MKMELPDQALTQLQQHVQKARELLSSGNTTHAEVELLAAWSAIPEPKADFDYAQDISSAMVEFYRDIKQFTKAHEWLRVVAELYGTDKASNVYVDLMAATVFFQSGDLEKAFETFDRLYREYQSRPFQALDASYLAFYKKQAAARQAKGE